jgi:hypothetical protein
MPDQPKRRMTRAEYRLWWCMVHNLAQEVAYRVRRYNDNEGVSASAMKRREREMFRAIATLAKAHESRPSDAALRYFDGEEEVQRRDQLLGKSAKVEPLKRRGHPLG